MFGKIKKKIIIESSNRLLENIWDDVDVHDKKIEINRQIINNNVIILSLDKLYCSPIIIKDSFIILDIGCGIMSWEATMTKFLDPEIKDRIYVFGIDQYDFLKIINYKEFDSIKKVIKENLNIINNNYDVLHEGIKHKNETIDFVFQRDMISIYKIDQWDQIIKEIYRVLKHNCYSEIIEYNIDIKKNFNKKTIISDIYNKTLIDIFKINGQEINIMNLYKKIVLVFGEENVELIKKEIPLYYEDNIKGIMTENMALGYNYFKKPLLDFLKLKEEWEESKSYMELYIIVAKKI